MSTVREILEARKAKLSIELEPLTSNRNRLYTELMNAEEKISEARNEISEIERALKSLNDSQGRSERISIIQAVLETLKHKPQGMTAQEILSELNAKYFEGNLRRHSLSPQLSRLKDRDKKIELKADRWIRLPDQPSLFKKGDRRF
jgi:predicted  nucleic acid-binding Zn-ribbon protein